MDNKQHLSVVKFPAGNLQDIPGMLRRIANQIESGELSRPKTLLLVAEIAVDNNGFEIDTYALGEACDIARFIGLLQMVQIEMTTGQGTPITDKAG